jgi:hypothetical protein
MQSWLDERREGEILNFPRAGYLIKINQNPSVRSNRLALFSPESLQLNLTFTLIQTIPIIIAAGALQDKFYPALIRLGISVTTYLVQAVRTCQVCSKYSLASIYDKFGFPQLFIMKCVFRVYFTNYEILFHNCEIFFINYEI